MADLFADNVAWAEQIARRVHRKMPPSIELDDLVQEALIELHRRVGMYDPAKNDNFQGYAYQAVYGACLMACRRRHYRNATAAPLDCAEVTRVMRDQEDAGPAVAQREELRAHWREVRRRQLLRLRLQRIPEAYQELARMVLVEGGTIEAAAAEFGITIGEVRRRLRAAAKVIGIRAKASTGRQSELLRLLSQQSGASVGAIAAAMGVHRRTVWRLKRDLATRGLLKTRGLDRKMSHRDAAR